ncbi:MAG: glycosyltransferase family 2 protein [Solobacterium sp.]|nr:glycosyltransferase family 2 protein [Solobacterium sp.]
MEISVVIPVYGCREALPELHRRLTETLKPLTADDYEIILVDDCCPQNSWEEIEKICAQDKRVTGLHLSRNFGQMRAITAGLDESSGRWVVVMDCDLQDRPEAIADLYRKALEGYDVVFARRVDRKDTKNVMFLSHLYYKFYEYFTDSRADNAVSNFSICSRPVIDHYCSMREQNRSFTMFIKWLGYKQTTIDVQADPRFAGESSYSFRRKMKLALEIITTQSNKPLMFSVRLGFTIAFLAFLYIVYLVIHAFMHHVVEGWTTIVASIYLMGGILLAAVGIVGIYVGNIFNETKDRPLYIVQKKLNGEER